mmetsp:Transcript_28525/g.62792  ORF Transcript_28525/g.62792 Transcript_28525/m.62792 type:complete len:131 (-) Transcript_28525:669-1061(-)
MEGPCRVACQWLFNSCTKVDTDVVADSLSAMYVSYRAAIGSYWTQDMGMHCYEGPHLVLTLCFGLPLLFMWAVGVPLFSALWFWRQARRALILGEPPLTLPQIQVPAHGQQVPTAAVAAAAAAAAGTVWC